MADALQNDNGRMFCIWALLFATWPQLARFRCVGLVLSVCVV